MGLPLPLGSIIASKELDDDIRKRFEHLLRRSIEYAFANPMVSREFIKQHAQELDDQVIDSHIALFVNDYSLTLGEEGRRAVEALL
jgi:1,4-dihydroxy-6-naphthoate synthase